MSDAIVRRNLDWRYFVRRALAVIAGAVFIYAGVLKAHDPLHFAGDLRNYQMMPWSVGVRFAFYLPWLEIFCGLALVLNRLFAGAIALTIALTCAFIGATAWAKVHDLDISCGCFGSAGSNLTLTWHFVLDGLLLLGLVYLWFTREHGR